MSVELKELGEANMRHSDVDGFTIVERRGRRPRVHLLRPWNECNTEKGKSGSDTIRIEGSREQLAIILSEMGYRRGGVACRRCFPHPAEADSFTPVEQYAETPFDTVDRRDTLLDE